MYRFSKTKRPVEETKPIKVPCWSLHSVHFKRAPSTTCAGILQHVHLTKLSHAYFPRQIPTPSPRALKFIHSLFVQTLCRWPFVRMMSKHTKVFCVVRLYTVNTDTKCLPSWYKLETSQSGRKLFVPKKVNLKITKTTNGAKSEFSLMQQ